MRTHGLWYAVLPLTAGLLAGCGGGGGGSGYTAPTPAPTPPPPMATVSFQAPAATSINFGQAVQLNWTSSNATSCTGSSSSDIGEAFNGKQGTSGPVTVAPTGAGNVTFTLTCSGAGGSASATSAAITVNPSILKLLSAQAPTKIVEIGSTMVANETNPYGLAIAPAAAGKIAAGDLIACNFNSAADNSANPPQEGDGSTIVAVHPTPGSTPTLIAQADSLKGCNALAVLTDDTISVAAYTAKANPFVTATGTVVNPLAATDFAGGPWGEVYVPAKGSNPAVVYISTVSGAIDRINGDGQGSFTEIAKGFCGGGSPGAIYGPSGLTYDASIDTLYIVDTASYSVVAFANVSSIGADGVVVNGQCPAVPFTAPTPEPTFGGPSGTAARVIANGGNFVAPLSAALLADGNLIVTNADINFPASGATPNLAFEISPVLPKGFVGDPVQLDTGNPGALFGIVATVDAQGHQIIYFNDDNANAIEMLTQ